MDTSGLPEPMRARIAERMALPAIEKVRALLHGYVADAEDFHEVRRDLASTARTNTVFLRQYLDALEAVLAEPQPAGTLLRLVEVDANWGIDHDQTDAGAAVFLREIARLLQDVLDAVE
ncbi:hypothetical protein COUCH_31190 [Couchioplanes caeruleus]|uniref:hypothetical protein n=1 Tax=Couchioplanes caeruleus TaxID=56438 RepID=UPI0020C147B6|nr:hypothetical protein [Couchioplanes caeruleus]UQU63442.1 hypothetical protein COUCH_31190 [Couchioplanes caeruleus]